MKLISVILLLSLTLFITVQAQEAPKSDSEIKSTFYTRDDNLSPSGSTGGRILPAVAADAVDLNNYGTKLFFDKNYNQSAKYFRQAAELLPDNATIQINLANALLNGAEHFTEAIAICRKSIEDGKINANVYAILGNALFETGDYAGSAVALQNALDIDKHNAVIFNDLGRALYKTGEYQASLTALDNALKIQPDFPSALNNYGITLVKLKRYKEAAQRFEQLTKLEPDSAEALNNLGIVYYYAGKHQKAQKCFLEAARLHPELSDSHYNLGMAYIAQNNRTEARKCLETLKKLNAEKARDLEKMFYKDYIINVSDKF